MTKESGKKGEKGKKKNETNSEEQDNMGRGREQTEREAGRQAKCRRKGKGGGFFRQCESCAVQRPPGKIWPSLLIVCILICGIF